MSRPVQSADSLRAAVSVLIRAREAMLDQMAEVILSMADEFSEGGFQVNEFLEVHGSRLHFLCLLIGQFELLGEARAQEAEPPPEPARPREKRPRRREEPPPLPAGEEASSARGEEAGNDS